MTELQLNVVDEDTLDTILAADVAFEGDLTFREPLMIKGRFKGTINTESDLHIDTNAVVEADIRAVNVTVRGAVRGNIAASGRVDLFSTCHMEGAISAGELTMEPGCRFNGSCSMSGTGTPPPAVPASE